VDVDIGSRQGLHLSLRSISKEGSEIDSKIFLSNLKVRDGSKHSGIVVVELRCLILKSNNLETLATNMASMNRSLSNKVEHLLMRVRIIFNTWTHADDNSPTGVRGENKNRVINSSEL